MIKTIEVEINDEFEGCNDCIHDDDTEAICKLRCCIHAVSLHIKDCYEPKEREEQNDKRRSNKGNK